MFLIGSGRVVGEKEPKRFRARCRARRMQCGGIQKDSGGSHFNKQIQLPRAHHMHYSEVDCAYIQSWRGNEEEAGVIDNPIRRTGPEADQEP
jgi:hypothetical protein